MNPIEKFDQWYKNELAISDDKIPSACCLSTIGLDKYPNARFVSLKAIIDQKFLITCSKNSKKGLEIKENSKTALSFWWPKTEKQIRIQGKAENITDRLADKFFQLRSSSSKLVSTISQQGEEIGDYLELEKTFKSKLEKLKDREIARPKHWSGYLINPIRIEFLDFRSSRLHYRQLYSWDASNWTSVILQP